MSNNEVKTIIFFSGSEKFLSKNKMPENITEKIKKAISVDALWSVSDFFHLIEVLEHKGFGISHWKGEENWATLLLGNDVIGYIWQKYPLIFIKADHLEEMNLFIEDLKYIVLIKSKDLISAEFKMDMDRDLIDRINYGINTESFSANDLWFHTSTI